jgi:hypothetical protein
VADVLRRILPWLGIVALVVVAVVTAGWGDAPATSTRPDVPSPSSSPTEDSVALTAAQAYRLVGRAALRRGDLPDGFAPVPDGPGDRLDAPSLELCGASFDSERYRLATNTLVFAAPQGRGEVQNVVVVYQPGYAARALTELAAAAPRCTRSVPPGHLEQPDTLALRLRSTGPRGSVRHDLVVERRGDVLSLLRVDGRQGYLTLDLATRLGNRLEAQLP